MRTYLVIMDESAEARAALRFASRRAARVDGALQLLAIAAKQDFVAFGGVQATIEEEARDRAEVLAMGAAGSLIEDGGKSPQITVRVGNASEVIREYLAEHPEVTALVLGAAPDGSPGPLVAHFSAHAGDLPCPLFIVPGGLDDEELERMS